MGKARPSTDTRPSTDGLGPPIAPNSPEGFVSRMGYQYKIGDHGPEAILTDEDEY